MLHLSRIRSIFPWAAFIHFPIIASCHRSSATRLQHLPLVFYLLSLLPSFSSNSLIHTPTMDYQLVDSDADRVSQPTVNYFSIRVCVIIAVLCTLVNIIVTTSFPMIDLPHPARALSRQDISLLRRPSQFIGFDNIERPSPPKPRRFHNYPILVATIDSAAADKAFGHDLKRVMSPAGTISFDESHVIVNQTVSARLSCCLMFVASTSAVYRSPQ